MNTKTKSIVVLIGVFIIGIIIGISISLVKVLISVAVAACITYFFPANIAAMSATMLGAADAGYLVLDPDGEAVARELGVPADRVFKTLVALVDGDPVVGKALHTDWSSQMWIAEPGRGGSSTQSSRSFRAGFRPRPRGNCSW